MSFATGFQRKPVIVHNAVQSRQSVVNFWFPLKKSSLLWPIGAKLRVWVAYIKMQLEIATKKYVIKVKVTVVKNRNSRSAQYLEFALAY